MSVADLFDTMNYGPAPESPAVVQAWLDSHQRQFDLFIDNQWHAPANAAYLEVKNPATGAALAKVANAAESDVDKAVQTARRAFESWGKTSGHARARYLYAIARNIQKHARLFAVLESMDNGKPIRESRDIDIPLVVRHFYHHAGWAQLAPDELADYQPVGVVGQIIPWNFPLLMLAWKIAPALAMGNTVVLKPAPYTPLTALLFAEIVAEAGLPPGVVNIVTGGDETGAFVVAHRDIDKIAFTGSTNVGRILRRVTAGTGKRLTLELGGKSPFIVFDDADQEGAVEGLVDAIWFNQGQVCCAGSRLLVQENIADKFLEKVRRRMAHLRTGDSLDKTIDLGAVVDPIQYNTIDRWVKIAKAEGATIFQPDIPMPQTGCFYPPTLLTNISSASTVAQEEIFGPVLVAMTFRTPAEAVELANNTRYGLAASIWSENINLALETAHKVKAGSIWVNSTNLFDAASGFGGYRESGFGREGGREGLVEYMRPVWQSRPPHTDPGAFDLDRWSSDAPSFPPALNSHSSANGLPPLDRTSKLYIAGKQKRPDGNYSQPVLDPGGHEIGQVGKGNRKDIRDAVEAAHAAKGWADRSPHERAQILYYIAENLAIRSDEFAQRLVSMTGCTAKTAQHEIDLSIDRLFTYAAWADKFGGTVQETTLRGLVVATHDYLGVIGIVCPDEYPLLAFVSLVAPAIARGNTIVAIPSAKYPLCATDFYQILETSDLPAGVINIVTGSRDHLTRTLVEHEDVDAVWYFGSAEGSYFVELLSVANLKRTWVSYGKSIDWTDRHQGAGEEFLRAAIQVKNTWVPTGV
ncbi:MAG: aldehyde dehydrogenase family protein [Chloroflexi bacterium]|nr:aldehyde dehydrogenase family protein [Chloroflexota bacterium]